MAIEATQRITRRLPDRNSMASGLLVRILLFGRETVKYIYFYFRLFSYVFVIYVSFIMFKINLLCSIMCSINCILVSVILNFAPVILYHFYICFYFQPTYSHYFCNDFLHLHSLCILIVNSKIHYNIMLCSKLRF